MALFWIQKEKKKTLLNLLLYFELLDIRRKYEILSKTSGYTWTQSNLIINKNKTGSTSQQPVNSFCLFVFVFVFFNLFFYL